MQEAKGRRIIIYIILAGVLGVVCFLVLNSLSTGDSYAGEFIRANKVYMPDNNIKLVIYFNDTSDGTKFVIFDSWQAKHSIILSNMEEGVNIKINYKEYIIGGDREIVRIENI